MNFSRGRESEQEVVNEQKPTKYVVTLQPLANVTDPIKALRALLKRALRSYGLKCISLREEPAGDQS
jgi:hypothetical protein